MAAKGLSKSDNDKNVGGRRATAIGRRQKTQPPLITLNFVKWALLCWITVVLHYWIGYRDGHEVVDTQRLQRLIDRPDCTTTGGTASSVSVTDRSKANGPPPPKRSKAEGSKAERKTFDQVKNLPEALQPVSQQFANASCCLLPSSMKDADSLKNTYCFGVCFTDRACDDPFYPFASAEEKAQFPLEATIEKKELRRKCHQLDSLKPPVKWCSDAMAVNNGRNATPFSDLLENIPPPQCSMISNAAGSGAFTNLILFPSAKLAFCGIPKVGITQWIQFARFVAGAKDYLSFPHHKKDFKFFLYDKLDSEAQRRIWEDDEWTFAAFIREPAERLLSAYLDKLARLGPETLELLGIEGEFSFQHFVDRVSLPYPGSSCGNKTMKGMHTIGLNWCTDLHWRPQIYSCGMSEHLDRFQYLGDISDISSQSRVLLQKVGLWESHGKKFIYKGVKPAHSCAVRALVSDEQKAQGFQQKDKVRNVTVSDTAYRHNNGANNKIDQYYTPELLRRVREDLYAEDYKVWKLISDKGELASGKELLPHLSDRCAVSE